MNMLITYDIADPRRLQRVAKVMEDYGLRVQHSVFETEVSPRQFREMKLRTEAEMDMTEDGVKFFPLCKQCDYLWFSLGLNGIYPEDHLFQII